MVKTSKYLTSLQPYVAGKPIEELAREKGLTRIVKLASNENPLGPSPKAMAAARAVMEGNHRYCDPGAYELVQALSAQFGKPASRFICGAGTDSLLGYIVGAFSEVGDEVLTSAGTFIGIRVNTQKLGRTLRQVPLKQYGYDLRAIAEAINERTRIVYLANPNNPTGTMFTASEFEAFLKRVPDEVLVLLDEAYAAYAAGHSDYPNGLRYERDNLVVTRTLSKDYGLAGLRVGYACGPERLICELYKIKLPFEPSLPAQKAAVAALSDDEHIERTVAMNRRSLDRLMTRFDEIGMRYVHGTAANFLLLLFADERQAASFTEACMNRGLILRHVKSFGIPEGVRINSGTDEETAFAIDVIARVAAELKIERPVATGN